MSLLPLKYLSYHHYLCLSSFLFWHSFSLLNPWIIFKLISESKIHFSFNLRIFSWVCVVICLFPLQKLETLVNLSNIVILLILYNKLTAKLIRTETFLISIPHVTKLKVVFNEGGRITNLTSKGYISGNLYYPIMRALTSFYCIDSITNWVYCTY